MFSKPITLLALTQASLVFGLVAPVSRIDDTPPVYLNGTFGTAVELEGNDKLQAVRYKSASGLGEIEVAFANMEPRSLTVTDNKTPGKAPEGYVFLDPVSYIVSFKDADMSNVTIQEMNYEFDPKNAEIAKALSTDNQDFFRTGRLDAATKAFVILEDSKNIAIEYDDPTNELAFITADVNGEWAFFKPDGKVIPGGSSEPAPAPAQEQPQPNPPQQQTPAQ